MCSRRYLFSRASEPDAGREWSHGKAQALEDPEEETVLFKAISAPPVGDELLFNSLGFEADAALEQDVEILERDGGDVGELQVTEDREGRLAGSGVSDAGEVCGEVDGALRWWTWESLHP